MTLRPYGAITLRCRPLFQSYSRRLLLLFALRSLRRQWKAVRRIAIGRGDTLSLVLVRCVRHVDWVHAKSAMVRIEIIRTEMSDKVE